jgi:hypothetical protein
VYYVADAGTFGAWRTIRGLTERVNDEWREWRVMMADGIRIDIGVWGWASQCWCREYYPEDMPEEWRATYYANEFRCAGLPADAWSVPQLEAWREDLPASFALWLECGQTQLADSATTPAMIALGERLAGVWLLEDANAGPLREAGIHVIDAPWGAEEGRGEASAGLYRLGATLDLRAARGVLEAFAVAPGPQRRQLLVEGSPVQLAQLRELGELLGL